MSIKKNCETNPITSQESWWFPEIEGQRNQANLSAGWTRSAPVPSPMSVRCPVLVATSQAPIPTIARTTREKG
jgi:hypothetical protein